MKLKEFFRPTIAKVILMIIIFLLLPIPFKSNIIGGPWECNGLRTCKLGERIMVAPFGGVFLIVAVFVGGNQLFERIIDYLWKIPYLIFLSYLISCLIIFIFNKIKPKSKR